LKKGGIIMNKTYEQKIAEIYKVVEEHHPMLGAVELRETLESLPCPIYTGEVSDEELEGMERCLISDLVEMLYQDDWMDLYEDEEEKDKAVDKLSELWWEQLEHAATELYEMPYYEDMDDDEDDEDEDEEWW
jgi:hypothetical protein